MHHNCHLHWFVWACAVWWGFLLVCPLAARHWKVNLGEKVKANRINVLWTYLGLMLGFHITNTLFSAWNRQLNRLTEQLSSYKLLVQSFFNLRYYRFWVFKNLRCVHTWVCSLDMAENEVPSHGAAKWCEQNLWRSFRKAFCKVQCVGKGWDDEINSCLYLYK